MLYDCTFVKVFWHRLTQKFISKIVYANQQQLLKELVIFGVKENVIIDKPLDHFYCPPNIMYTPVNFQNLYQMLTSF